MDNLLLIPLAACLLLAGATATFRAPWLNRFAGIIASGGVLVCGVSALVSVMAHGPLSAAGGGLRADALSAFMLTVVGSVGLNSTWGGLVSKQDAHRGTWVYQTLVTLFLGTMSLAVLADNLGVMWVAIEATTVTTAFLVGYQSTRRSLEAAWKYVVIGSVGVAIAFLGIVLIYAATLSSGTPTLSWVSLHSSNLAVDPAVIKVAVALAILGFATKAGLAPMHSWLPDAHSQSPAPVSGLMSGVLLSVAFYAILRVQAIAGSVLGAGFVRWLLIGGGILSMLVSAALIWAQKDLKRMLAYSSIEHMGIVAVAAGIGGRLAIAAAMLHVLVHGLAKSSAFVLAGRITTAEGTTEIGALRSLLERRPGLTNPFLAAMVALVGLPPFALFFTEVAIVFAGFRSGLPMVMIAFAFLILINFVGLVRHSTLMVFGKSERSNVGNIVDSSWHGSRISIIAALSASIVVPFLMGFGHVLARISDLLAVSR
ncbi:MAG TPA: proton-conducting transporter membrane subunit [Candidatus Nanopelagicaceae bacterium]|nr:proton-conducting transporter membrane subunit [Candidatus Nanopelagicaceae bacterium]